VAIVNCFSFIVLNPKTKIIRNNNIPQKASGLNVSYIFESDFGSFKQME